MNRLIAMVFALLLIGPPAANATSVTVDISGNFWFYLQSGLVHTSISLAGENYSTGDVMPIGTFTYDDESHTWHRYLDDGTIDTFINNSPEYYYRTDAMVTFSAPIIDFFNLSDSKFFTDIENIASARYVPGYDTVMHSWTGNDNRDNYYTIRYYQEGPEGLTTLNNVRPQSTLFISDTHLTFASSAIPEPTTILLLCAGLVGIAGIGRKRLR